MAARSRGSTSFQRTGGAPCGSNRRHDVTQQVEDLTDTLYETNKLMQENEQLLNEYQALSRRHHQSPPPPPTHHTQYSPSSSEIENQRLRNELERERLARERTELDNSKLLGVLHQSLNDRIPCDSSLNSPPPPPSTAIADVRDGQKGGDDKEIKQLKEELATVKAILLKQQVSQQEHLLTRISQIEHQLSTHAEPNPSPKICTDPLLNIHLDPLVETRSLQSATEQLIERVSKAEEKMSSLLEIEKRKNSLLRAELKEKDMLFHEMQQELNELIERFGLSDSQSKNLIGQFQIVATKLREILEEKEALVTQVHQLKNRLQEKSNNLQATTEILQRLKKHCQTVQIQLEKSREERENTMERVVHLERQCSDYELKVQQMEASSTHSQQLYKRAQEQIEQAEAEREKLLRDRVHISESLQEQVTSLRAELCKAKQVRQEIEQQHKQELSLIRQQHATEIQQLKADHTHQVSHLKQQIADLQLEVADGQSMLRAVRKQQGKWMDEQDKLGKDLSRSQQDSEKLLRKYHKAKVHFEKKAAALERELSEEHAEEIRQLLNQLSLSQKQTEEHERLFQSLEDEVNCLVSKMGLKSDTEVPVRHASDPRNHIALALAKLRWLQGEAEHLTLREQKARMLLQQQQDLTHAQVLQQKHMYQSLHSKPAASPDK